jgi:hypothetical protein
MLTDDDRRRLARQAVAHAQARWPLANTAVTLAVAQELAARITDGFEVRQANVVELARLAHAVGEAELAALDPNQRWPEGNPSQARAYGRDARETGDHER